MVFQNLKTSTKSAFASWLVVFGIVASSFTIIRIAFRVYEIGISRFFLPAVKWYDENIGWNLNALVNELFELRLTIQTTDGVLVWLTFGIVVTRPILALNFSSLALNLRVAIKVDFTMNRLKYGITTAWRHLASYVLRLSILHIFLISILIVFWPFSLIEYFKRPHFYRLFDSDIGHHLHAETNKEEIDRESYCGDFRVMVLVQTLAFLCAAVFWIATNFLISEHGI